MLKYGNRDFRNLQEQVYANMKNIQDIIDGSNIIADFKTINIVGEVDIAANLPDPDLYQGEYGDCFIVGDAEEYDLYIFTKAYEEQNAPQWFDLGTFPKPGPEGPQGIQGPQGPQGEQGIQGIQGVQGSIWYFGTDVEWFGDDSYIIMLSDCPNIRANDLYLVTDTYVSEGHTIEEGDYFKVIGVIPSSGYAGLTREGNLKGDQGAPGIISDATTLNSFLQGSGAAVIGVNQAGTKVDIGVNPGVGLDFADSKLSIADIPTVTVQTEITDADLLSWVEDKKGPVIINGKVYYAFSEDDNSIYYISYNWSTGLGGNIIITRPTYSKASHTFGSDAGQQHIGGLASNSFKGSIKVAAGVQSAPASNVTAILGRTYQVQILNNSEQAVVNVPWPNIAASNGLEATDSADGTTKTISAKLGDGISLDSNGALMATGQDYPVLNTLAITSPEVQAWIDQKFPVIYNNALYTYAYGYTDGSKYYYVNSYSSAGSTPGYVFRVMEYTTATHTFASPQTTQFHQKPTNTYWGLIKVYSTATQSVAPNSPSVMAGRTYPVQLNSSDYAVVNVPWIEVVANPTLDGTETPLTAIEINGVKYTIGS